MIDAMTRPRERVTVTLAPHDRDALAAMANQDARYPKQQITWLIRQEAKRRGLLTDPPDPPTTNEGHAVTLDKSGAPFGVQS